jgi:hypothetical protein
MPRGKQMDPALLQAALDGFEQRLKEVNEKIVAVRRMMRSPGRPASAAPAAPARRRRPMSAAARKRIADAQKRRWAAFHSRSAKKAAGRRRG